MKIIVDTNVMVRSFVRDDQAQANTAAKILTGAAIIAIALPCLCKFARALQSIYIIENAYAIGAFRANGQQNVEMNRSATEAGLGVLNEGSDFTNGVIALEDNYLWCETFVSFDKQARLL